MTSTENSNATKNGNLSIDNNVSNAVEDYNDIVESQLDKMLEISIMQFNRTQEKIKVQRKLDFKRKKELEKIVIQIDNHKASTFNKTIKIPTVNYSNKNNFQTTRNLQSDSLKNSKSPVPTTQPITPERPKGAKPSNKAFQFRSNRSRKLMESSMKMLEIEGKSLNSPASNTNSNQFENKSSSVFADDKESSISPTPSTQSGLVSSASKIEETKPNLSQFNEAVSATSCESNSYLEHAEIRDAPNQNSNIIISPTTAAETNKSAALRSKSLNWATYNRTARDAIFTSTASAWLHAHPEIMNQVKGLSLEDMEFQMAHKLQRENKQKSRYKDNVMDTLVIDGSGLKGQEKFFRTDYQENFNAVDEEFKNAVREAKPTDYGLAKSPFIYIKRRP